MTIFGYPFVKFQGGCYINFRDGFLTFNCRKAVRFGQREISVALVECWHCLVGRCVFVGMNKGTEIHTFLETMQLEIVEKPTKTNMDTKHDGLNKCFFSRSRYF